MRHPIFKLIQRKTYTCLSHKLGIYFAYGAIVMVLYSLLHFGEELMSWSQYQYDMAFSIYHDNIASRSFQRRLCSEVPIDVVYTWVNGSDPLLIAELNKAKLQQDFNATRSKNLTDYACNLSDCMLLPLLVVSPHLTSTQKEEFMTENEVLSCFDLTFMKDVLGHAENNVSVFRFKNLNAVRSAHLKGSTNNQTITRFHVTTDNSAAYSMRLLQALIFKSIPSSIKTKEELLQNVPNSLKDAIDWLHFGTDKRAALAWLKDMTVVEEFFDEKSNSSLRSGFKIDDESITIHSAYFVGVIESQGHEDVISKSRFEDNEELRYSLRSVEKYAPWVRHIFIVTNGQIPYWLNMDSPYITLVTHEDIFVNKSHLPTFSSPAIEAHLHRIPGLADKFIYFNDDVMFGKEVWPDDFYTHSSGQKVYLTWPVPNCAEGCAPSWITDGYCDTVCNVSECNWDGGDCTGPNVKAGVGMSNNFGNNWQPSFGSYCRPGCSTAWLADKFCDQACNTHECGFDAGDCGLANYEKVYKLASKLKNGTTYHLPPGKLVGYVEISKTFEKVTAASFDSNEHIRMAAVSNKFHVITIVFNADGNQTEIAFNVTGIPSNNSKESLNKKGDSEVTIFMQFKVTAFPSQNDTNDADNNHKEDQQSEEEKDHDTDVKVETEREETFFKSKDNLPEAIFVDISEDMKRPSTQRTQKLPNRELPFSLDNLNITILPKDVQEQFLALEEEYRKEYLTEQGYKFRLYEFLYPYFKLLSDHQNSTSIVLLENKLKDKKTKIHDVGKQGNTGDSLKKNKESDFEGENDHFHFKGDQGIVETAQNETQQQGFLRNDIPHINESKLKEVAKQENVENNKTGGGFVSRNVLSLKSALLGQPSNYGFLPWEHDKKIQHDIKRIEDRQKVENDYKTTFKKRKLLDTFGDSLRFVSGIFNKRFGFTQRKVPAHMPHFIDKNIMYELQNKFPEEYDLTSSHQFRHSKDMQFAFSYFYYIMSERKSMDLEEIFLEFDTDLSGVLSDREIRLFATKIFSLPLTLEELTSVEAELKRCAWELYGSSTNTSESGNATYQGYTQPTNGLADWAVTEKYYASDMPLVTKELMFNCTFIMEHLNKTYSDIKKYKFQEVDQNEIAFKMIRDNVSTVVGQLDDVRKNPKKFICLNDNMNHNLEQAATVKAVIRDFYESLFPIQSKFELPYEYRNRFTNINELREWKISHQRTLHTLHFILGCLFFSMIISFFWDHIFKQWRRHRHKIFRTFSKYFRNNRKSSPV
ncbi:N-acetylglucosamine-1-phosphotransferase subunits alpha/beta-like isoform X2 [Clavelina lepadiformis]|uniref:N-acetylglucosamine-1-phosphotransferase subunits alpha/beta-like isoform X2 n=1 Tax=Clavelina lepadiformis TaxID=159417 RepID=UPI00404115A1